MNGHRFHSHLSTERGIALITVMLLLMLTSSILAGFLVVTSNDTKLRGIDRTRTQAFYAAHAGLEKLTSDLGDLFAGDFSPEADDLETIEGEPPAMENVVFEANDGLGYKITFNPDADGNPEAQNGTIASGPFQGFTGLITSYGLSVTSRTIEGSEARLQRTMNTVAIPVFQFGVFSETDLTFSANGTFSFGGRVHTNGNLYLAAASGGNLYLGDKVTAVGEVIRTHLANTRSIVGSHEGNVLVSKTTGTCTLPSSPSTACRALATSEGSLVNTIGSSPNLPTWTNLFGIYNGYLRNYRNGITSLQLPLVSEEAGGAPIDLIKRPTAGESDLLRSQRLYSQASIRILLSDTAAEITSLAGVSAGDPLELTAPVGYVPIYAAGPPVVFRAPLARSSMNAGTAPSGADGYRTPNFTPLVGGWLKVEYRAADDSWNDVTLEWLNLGITRRNIDAATQLNSNTTCAEPNPDAILRLQRIRQNPSVGVTAATICTQNAGSITNPQDYWPLVMYDIREAYNRDTLVTTNLDMYMAGVIHYIDLDVNNLRRWLEDTIGTSGDQVVNEDGYVVYFSDRRGNKNADGTPANTGEFGWEDFINPASATGVPNGVLDGGEDVNSDGTQQLYGGTAQSPTGSFAGAWSAPFVSTATPRSLISAGGGATAANIARVNPTLFFRRALRVSNGGLGNLPVDGLTIASENPVYLEGHYNAGPTSWGATNRPAAILADAITLQSANWNIPLSVSGTWMGHGDTRSLRLPNNSPNREAVNTWYRFAALSGKGRNWTQTSTPASFGTDGGVHNFLRFIEDWNEGGRTVNYRGSLASFYYSRQGVGLFRCCTNVYELPANRNLSFDTNFLNPSLLPPKTPMFRDINTTGFVQVTRRQ